MIAADDGEPRGRCACWRGRSRRAHETLRLGLGPDLGRCNNQVTTAKYTLLTFLPFSFFGQFRHFANLYFLVVFIIALLGEQTSLNWFQTPLPSSGFLLTLAIVVCLSMLFEGWYDFYRHREDYKVNNRKACRLRNGVEETVTWKEVHPGDVLLVDRDQFFPADLLFLAALPNLNASHLGGMGDGQDEFDGGKCYVETSNIDGETNLKVRLTPQTTGDVFNAGGDWSARTRGWDVVYDLPKPNLEFSGVLVRSSAGGEKPDAEDPAPSLAQAQVQQQQQLPLDFQNILLRGSILKNTYRVVGVVLYAGVETKAVQSTAVTKTKVSNAVRLVNMAIVFILFVGLCMDLVSAGISSIQPQSLWYLGAYVPYVFGPFWSSFFTYIILYSNLLPISLLIAITITNFIQAMFVNFDLQMYDESKDRNARCATMELAQEIGQVSFVFSDKTGTLTRNEMKLVGCTVGADTTLGLGSEAYEPQESDRPLPEIFSGLVRLLKERESGGAVINNNNSSSNNDDVLYKSVCTFLAVLSVCHTVLVESEGGVVKYNAEGPDEEALVGGVALLGFRLLRTSRQMVTIESKHMPAPYASPDGIQHKFEILAINPFDSTRKRMSTVVRLPNGSIELMVKGADSVMKELLVGNPPPSEMARFARIGEHLDQFANNGLRTLVIARRTVPQPEFDSFVQALQFANSNIGADKVRLATEAATILEHDLHVVGATAIEDRLQDGVPETLRMFRSAGIKTWVLTGDKVETAINIGHSAGLLTNEMDITILDGKPERNLEMLREMAQRLDPAALAKLQESMKKGKRKKNVKSMGSALLSPTRRSHTVNLETSEASGEDPYGMAHATKKAVGGMMENGFHAFSHVLGQGGKRMWRSSVGGGSGTGRRAKHTQNATPVPTPQAPPPNSNNAVFTEQPSQQQHSEEDGVFTYDASAVESSAILQSDSQKRLTGTTTAHTSVATGDDAPNEDHTHHAEEEDDEEHPPPPTTMRAISSTRFPPWWRKRRGIPLPPFP